MDYMDLKSGTDIRGVALQGDEEIDLTHEVVYRIAQGFAHWLFERFNSREEISVAVGNDSRISAQRIKKTFLNGLSQAGIAIKDCGLSSTPAMFMTTVNLGCSAAVEITASHHPFNKNGFKFFVRQGGLDSQDIEKILTYAQKGVLFTAQVPGDIEEINHMNTYAENLRQYICEAVNADDYSRPLRGFKIVVDAGNGAGGFYADKVLEPLGADITGSQFLEPDGLFPNHVPNPEDAQAMRFISQATVQNNADLGIIFDTDVDRAACVGGNGQEINKNKLIALASCIALEDNEGGTIVTDCVTSSGLKDFIENELSGRHHRFKRGYKNVINEAVRLNLECSVNAPLAIETSGHAAMRENYFLDDGAYLITRIIIKMAQLSKEGRTLESLIENLVEPCGEAEYRIGILDKNFKEYGDKVIKELEEYVDLNDKFVKAQDSYEGIRASMPCCEGWFLLRLSVHDPILPLNIESNNDSGVSIIREEVKNFLKNYANLDITSL
ncbi:MAG: phosphomannomutase/phosphoglucomutase [Oscillospiraceae bacterium]|jgi:phosphomannomutase|nr:phosphomannomutase/phosphoglucomutase [Oscillospiraceae bacterium]